MKRITPTRGWRFALVIGVAGMCAGVAAGQRHGGGVQSSRPSAPSYHESAPTYHQAPPAYRPGAPAYRQAGPEGYRTYAPQQQYRPEGGRPERYAQQQTPAPVERRAPQQQVQPNHIQPNQGQSSQLSQIERRNSQAPGAPRGEHLADWMNQHRNLTPQQQQQALQREPGFSQLPQQTQDRMRNRLAQLNAMDPQRRERILTYNERMEHLSAGQRTEVRNSLSQLGALPLDQRRQVAEGFRQLRELPPNQRAAAMNSPQYQYMSPAQRSTLNNLLQVEPLLPPSEQQPR